MLTHQQNARRKARRWQIGAAVCVAIAGAALFLPLEGLFSPKKVGVVKRVDVSDLIDPEPKFAAPNVGSSIQTLTALFPRVSPDPNDPEDLVTETSETKDMIPPAPPAPVGVWEYIGSIISPTSKRAFVRVDQQQHLLAEGAGVNATKVVSITADELVIETEGVRKVVALNTRTMDFPTTPPRRPVAFRTPGSPGAAGVGNMAAMPRPGGAPGGPSMMTPPPQASAAFDQQMRAQAMQEAARRGQRPMDMPKRIHGEQGEAMRKLLSDGGLDPSQKREIMQKMGIKAGTPTEQTLQQLKESGIEVDESMMGAAKELEGMGGGMSEEEMKKAEEAGKGG